MKRLERAISKDDIQKFHEQLRQYKDSTLRVIHEYFKEDLIHIVKNLNSHALLVALQDRKVLEAEKYCSLKKQHGAEFFANTLLSEILKLGKESVIGLWESLYELQKNHHHPNLLVALDEFSKRGDHLVEQIILDEHGHTLTQELKDMQMKHKQHLLENTETLVEHRPPGSTLDEKTFPINERYVDLMVVSSDAFRQRSQNELIQTGKTHEECLRKTQSGLEYISPNKLFRWSRESQCIPHTVMLSGVPGIGKTTLMQKFIYYWVTGKIYQRFAFVFFFRFRDLNKLPNVSLEEMILHQYPYLESQLNNILQNPEKLLFIFDGIDESTHQTDFTSPKSCTNSKWRVDSGVIVANLVTQRLLHGCSVLMTSRPSKLASIDTSVFKRIAEIMGFSHSDRLVYFEHFFGEKELSENAFQCVKANDTLYTFCYIPSFCWIICTVIRQQTNTDHLKDSLPKTITQLFVTFISNILANHCLNKGDGHTVRKLLTSIGWMAEYGVINRIIVFDERFLSTFKVSKEEHLFSCFRVESGQPTALDYSFLHLTLQEFFAALVHFIDYNDEKLQETLEKINSNKEGNTEILIRFLCGLSDISTTSVLNSHVNKLPIPASKQVINWLKQTITSQNSTQSKRKLLCAFYCLHESRNEALVLECMGSHTVIDFSEVYLSPVDCSVLSFILKTCKAVESLNLWKCNIQCEGLQKIVPALMTVNSLSLGWNNLTVTSCPILASGIGTTLKKLDLSNNNLDGPQFSELIEALTTSSLEELVLKYTHLTDGSCPPLASGIRNIPTLRRLDLTGNNIEGPHLMELMAALTASSIEELRLGWNNLTNRSCTCLASGIENNQTLRKLDLSGNNVEGTHFEVLMEALTTTKIEELVLENSHLTECSCPRLAAIKNCPNLKRLDLSYNNLEGPQLSELMAALPSSSIEELRLYKNQLKDSSCPYLASGIRDNHTLKILDLSGNKLEGPHLSDLMSALNNSTIEELVLVYDELTNASCLPLAHGIRGSPTLKRLNLSYNNLEGTDLCNLTEALTTCSIEELDLESINLTDRSCPHLASVIRNSPSLKRLNLSGNNLWGSHLNEMQEALRRSHIEQLEICKYFTPEEIKRQLSDLRSTLKVVW